MTFLSNCLHAVTFLHVLHLDVLKRQIEIETESKNSNILMYGYNAGQPMAIPIYTVLPYCVIYMYIVFGTYMFQLLLLMYIARCSGGAARRTGVSESGL